MVFTRRSKAIVAGVLAGLAFCAAPSVFPRADATTRIDADKIYYGDAQKYSRPAVVDAARVYRRIPAHQEILARRLTRNDPDYWPLMRKASQAFVKALKKVCQEKGYDLVGEVKTIVIDGQPAPEITDEVIDHVEGRAGGKPREKPSQDAGK